MLKKLESIENNFCWRTKNTNLISFQNTYKHNSKSTELNEDWEFLQDSFKLSYISNSNTVEKDLGISDVQTDLKKVIWHEELRKNFFSKIFKTLMKVYPFPEEWFKQGIEEPTEECTEKTLNICTYLFENFALMPKRISPSVEEGWYIFYISDFDKQKTLSIEIYNENLETIALINDNKQITYVKKIENLEFEEVVEKFNARELF